MAASLTARYEVTLCLVGQEQEENMSASIPENDGKPPRPTPAPRKLSVNKSSNKPTISAPFNFRHVSHVGIDFASHDVKKAIKPMTKIEEINDPPQEPALEKYDDVNEKISNTRKISESITPADRGNPDEIDTQRSAIPKGDSSLHQKFALLRQDSRPTSDTNEIMNDGKNVVMSTPRSRKKMRAPPPPIQLHSFSSSQCNEDIGWKSSSPKSLPEDQSKITFKSSGITKQNRSPKSPSSSTDGNFPKVHLEMEQQQPLWMLNLTMKEQKRLRELWLRSMGNEKLPHDKQTIMELIPRFEAYGGHVSPSDQVVLSEKPRNIRRVAPPPPSNCSNQLNPDCNEETICLHIQKQHSEDTGEGEPEAATDIKSTEKLDSSALTLPVPKPRQKKRAEKPDIAHAGTAGTGSPPIILPEKTTECVVTMSKSDLNIVGEVTYVLKDSNRNTKEEIEVTVERLRKELEATSKTKENMRTDHDVDGDDDIETTRF
ncbi:hypothetical protein RB195_010602 [Necator americanus]|uniref:CRIB domain-containing protein n=1 Tax=Necator americanus TaxID=51031 RepID=A0ABR1CZS8_NECAM